jgi:hypothetical protein
MSRQDQLPPLTTAALVRLAVISVIVFCIVASFAYAAGRHLTGPGDSTTVREPAPTDLQNPSERQPEPRRGLEPPLARSDLDRKLRGWEIHVA